MKPREVFALVIRLVGLAAMFAGLAYWMAGLYAAIDANAPKDASPLTYLVFGLVLIAASIYFVRGAPMLVRFAYPPSADDEDGSQ